MNLTIKPTTWRLGSAVQQFFKRSTSKIDVELAPHVQEQFDNNTLKPRKHPGLAAKQRLELPEQITNAIQHVIGDQPIKALLRDSTKLNQYILARHPPAERQEMRARMREIVEEVEQRFPMPDNFAELNEEDQVAWRRKRDQAIKKSLGERNYAWKPIQYSKYEALVYAVGRSAQEYAVLMHILQEIKSRDIEFRPRSFFDFGSGVGSGMWAASSLWQDCIYEYFNVDASRDMNELSELIMRDGNENKQLRLRNVFYRQFLPALDTKYDLVLSAYTLFELGNLQKRQETLLNLWRKCDNYLVLVEEGTRCSHELLMEARSFLLEQGAQDESLQAHVFAPCAHELPCPRLLNEKDRTPCNFQMSYKPLNVGNTKVDFLSTRYSYLVMKKGAVTDETREWPRLVRPTLTRSKHIICRMCTADARLQEVIFTQGKHGRWAYRCAKASRWGDRLPMTIGQPHTELKAEKQSEEIEIEENKAKN